MKLISLTSLTTKIFLTLCVVAVLLVSVSLFAQNKEKRIEYLDAFYAYIKGTDATISDEVLEQYIYDFHLEFYKKSRNDEFAWRAGMQKYREELNKGLASYNDDNILYRSVTDVEVEEYDFDKNGFPVSISDNAYLSIVSARHRGAPKGSKMMTDVGLKFPNFGEYNFLVMDSEKANSFIKSRSRQNNAVLGARIDRNVNIHIYFKIAPFDMPEYISFAQRSSKIYPVMGIIDRIEVFDGNTKLGNLIISK